MLLSMIYKDEGMPMVARLKAAEVCLAYEKAKPTAGAGTHDEQLAARLRAAQIRVGIRPAPSRGDLCAADVVAMARGEQQSAEAAGAALTAPITLDLPAEAEGVPPIIEGTAEAVTVTAPTSLNIDDYI